MIALSPDRQTALCRAVEAAGAVGRVQLADTVGPTFIILEIMGGNRRAGEALGEAGRLFPGISEYLFALIEPDGDRGPGELFMFTTPARPRMLITAVVLGQPRDA